jgi:hypothetical protein
MSFGGKVMRRGREKEGKCKRKRREGKEKGRKGRENEKRGSKRVKQMQNREELRQKGYNGSQKTPCRGRGENIVFRRGEGNKYCFRTEI